MKDEAAAVGGTEACVKPSRAKARSYAGLVGGAEEGGGRSRFAIRRAQNI